MYVFLVVAIIVPLDIMPFVLISATLYGAFCFYLGWDIFELLIWCMYAVFWYVLCCRDTMCFYTVYYVALRLLSCMFYVCCPVWKHYVRCAIWLLFGKYIRGYSLGMFYI